jgi:hypothetical protein
MVHFFRPRHSRKFKVGGKSLRPRNAQVGRREKPCAWEQFTVPGVDWLVRKRPVLDGIEENIELEYLFRTGGDAFCWGAASAWEQAITGAI